MHNPEVTCTGTVGRAPFPIALLQAVCATDKSPVSGALTMSLSVGQALKYPESQRISGEYMIYRKRRPAIGGFRDVSFLVRRVTSGSFQNPGSFGYVATFPGRGFRVRSTQVRPGSDRTRKLPGRILSLFRHHGLPADMFILCIQDSRAPPELGLSFNF